MAIQRVAVIFDDRARPETTGVYCRRALERVVEVVHFRPDALDQVPREAIDLYINIDDGFDYRLPPELHPSVFWAIDTHVNDHDSRVTVREFGDRVHKQRRAFFGRQPTQESNDRQSWVDPPGPEDFIPGPRSCNPLRVNGVGDDDSLGTAVPGDRR